MKLVELLDGIAPAPDLEIAAVADDSRAVVPGGLFVAVPGTARDGAAYADEALRRGAVAVVAERPLPLPIPTIVVTDVRRALAGIAAAACGRPAERLALAGVTGTNGKTTTSWLVHAMLGAHGARPALLGTIANRIGATPEPASLTTPGPLALHRFLARAVQAGATHAVMEVSSHALDQARVAGLRFRAAGFSNLTPDHLDHHRTMEAYGRAKQRLFAAHLVEDGIAVVNADDPAAAAMAAAAAPHEVWRCSARSGADVELRLRHCRSDADGTLLRLATPAGDCELASPLVGAFNVDNLLLASGLGLALGLPPKAVGAGAAALAGVPGRLERVPTGRGFHVFVDYAHTPDALERVMAVLRPLCTGRLVVVFGCGGDRDRTKRPVMGGLAARHADVVLATSDNPRTEDPLAILAEIERGRPAAARAAWTTIPDRRAAIARALELARPGDVVLLAGKGHEDYQIVGTTKLPFDDRAVARELLFGAAAEGAS